VDTDKQQQEARSTWRCRVSTAERPEERRSGFQLPCLSGSPVRRALVRRPLQMFLKRSRSWSTDHTMKKVTPKKKAPVQLTAGTGFRNENCIAARSLLDRLAGTNALGADFGKIDRVQWQGRDLGWLADDLVIECSASTGKRAAGISIKSDRQVTSAGFPPDFVGIAWAQWFGVKTERVLLGSDDAVVLNLPYLR
jgi:hypothetical protein